MSFVVFYAAAETAVLVSSPISATDECNNTHSDYEYKLRDIPPSQGKLYQMSVAFYMAGLLTGIYQQASPLFSSENVTHQMSDCTEQ